MGEHGTDHGADRGESQRAQQGMFGIAQGIGRNRGSQAKDQRADPPQPQDHPRSDSYGCANKETARIVLGHLAEKETGADATEGTHEATAKGAEKQHVERRADDETQAQDEQAGRRHKKEGHTRSHRVTNTSAQRRSGYHGNAQEGNDHEQDADCLDAKSRLLGPSNKTEPIVSVYSA